MKHFIFGLTFLLAACGPGIGDINIPLANGYFLFEAGGLEKAIIYEGNGRQPGFVVDSTVVTFKVSGDNIAVLRQPRTIYYEEAATPLSQAEKQCEYWLIDTKQHALKGPINKSAFMDLAHEYGFDETSLDTPFTDKTSKFCFN